MEFAEQVLSSPVFVVRRSWSTLLLGLVVSAVVIGVIFLLGSVLLGSEIPP
jgi:hypothetical protein